MTQNNIYVYGKSPNLSVTYVNYPSFVDVGLSIAIPSVNLTATGLTETSIIGESVVFGNVLYLKSDGKWWKADADAATTMPCFRMALSIGSANDSILLLSVGWAKNDAWNWTVGGLIYASATAGGMSQTAPVGTGDQIQVVGVAYRSDKMWFAPSTVFMEVV